MEEPEIPDPLETVTVLKSDLELQNRGIELASEDVKRIAAELGLVQQVGASPASLVPSIVAQIRQLKETQHQVDRAAGQLRERATQLGNQEITLANGQKGLLVGKRLLGGLPGVDTMTGAERRRFERENRS